MTPCNGEIALDLATFRSDDHREALAAICEKREPARHAAIPSQARNRHAPRRSCTLVGAPATRTVAPAHPHEARMIEPLLEHLAGKR